MHNDEFTTKLEMLYKFFDEKCIDGVLLSRRDDFAWITCGGNNWVFKFTDIGEVHVLITKDKNYVIASEPERYRSLDEEVCSLGFELVPFNWFEDSQTIIHSLIGEKNIASDTGISGTQNLFKDICRLRYPLLPEEILRLREVCTLTSNALYETCMELKPGDTEYEIGANLDFKLMKNGIQAPVCLIAADERIKKYRHPIPTKNKVSKYALVIVGAEKYGLFASASRMVSFGRPSDEIIEKHRACMEIDTAFITSTVVGAKVSDVLKAGVNQYIECGYPDEWKRHHQGGATGYHAREYLATFDSNEIVLANQSFSWNPTIAGTKCEDTFIVTPNRQEILTGMEFWPMVEIPTTNGGLKRPDILIR
jgi:Xaa-Pro aminopeptidase